MKAMERTVLGREQGRCRCLAIVPPSPIGPAHRERTPISARRNQELLKKIEQELFTLGDERSTTGHRRMFLSRLAMRFHDLTSSALNGAYHEVDAVSSTAQS